MAMSRVKGSLDLSVYVLVMVSVMALYVLKAPGELFIVLAGIFVIMVPGPMVLELTALSQRFEPMERYILSPVIGLAIMLAAHYLAPLFGLDDVGVFALVVAPVFTAFSVLLFWRRTSADERPSSPFIDSFYGLMGAKGWKGGMMTIFSTITIVLVVSASIVIFTGVKVDNHTEFYVLNEDGHAYDYPTGMHVGEEGSLILGVVNHEGRQVHYTIEAWLVNYSYQNMAVNVTEMYYVESFDVVLNDTEYDLNDEWQPQFEAEFLLNLTVPGNFTLFLMLFNEDVQPMPEEPMDPTKNYATTIASWRIVMCVNDDIQYLRLIMSVV